MNRLPTLKDQNVPPGGLLNPILRQGTGKGNFSNVLCNGHGVAQRGMLFRQPRKARKTSRRQRK